MNLLWIMIRASIYMLDEKSFMLSAAAKWVLGLAYVLFYKENAAAVAAAITTTFAIHISSAHTSTWAHKPSSGDVV